MSFLLNDEQQMIEDALLRVLESRWQHTTLADASGARPMQQALWQQLGELGLLGAFLPERLGGSNGGAAEAMIVGRAFGQHLVRLPILGGPVMGGAILAHHADAWPATFDPQALGSGALHLSLAVHEREHRYDVDRPSVSAQRTGQGYRLQGSKHFVCDGAQADWLIVSAAVDDGIGLFLLPAQSPGLQIEGYASVEGSSLATVHLRDVSVAAAARLCADQADKVLDHAITQGVFFAAAQTLGGCEAALRQTLAYLQVREQFGRRLASFQALQHRASDLHAELEMLRSQVLGAGLSLIADPMGPQARADVAAAACLATDIGDRIGREAIQMHGAIGMTRDLGVGRYLMQANFLWRLLGDAHWQQQRLLDHGLEMMS